MANYEERRKKLVGSIVGDCAVIVFSGDLIFKSEDATYPFYINRNFFYLTGLQRESMILLISKVNNVIDEKLFILPYDEAKAKWVGGRMKADEAKEISGIKNVYTVDEFDENITSLLNNVRRNLDFNLFLDLWHYDANQQSTPSIEFANKLKANYPSLNIKDIYPYIANMRLVKDRDEVECIKKAIIITGEGVKSMMTSIKPGINEMVMEGIFNFKLFVNHCRETAFDTICASGKRATILHYHENNHVIEDGDLLLCDLGATYNNYSADITRTFPANGKFSDRQKEIYNIVLNAQKIVEDNAKPGITRKELNDMVINYYKEELPKHGLTKDVREYYWHNVSHCLGLDTHDIDGGLGQTLKAGFVITNEPGLYIEEENIGIRIEDDLLITENGCEVLSPFIPKTVEDIENTMKG